VYPVADEACNRLTAFGVVRSIFGYEALDLVSSVRTTVNKQCQPFLPRKGFWSNRILLNLMVSMLIEIKSDAQKVKKDKRLAEGISTRDRATQHRRQGIRAAIGRVL